MPAELLVETFSCYAAICDEASAANRLGFMDAELRAGKAAARLEGLDECFGLFTFNDRLMHSANRGELLAWTLLLDGVFRAVATVESDASDSTQESKHFGSNLLSGTLACPTGRLILTCLSRLGVKQSPFLVLEPSLYRIQLERDESQEFEHCGLEGAASYPAGHGPDWQLQLQRLGPLQGGA